MARLPRKRCSFSWMFTSERAPAFVLLLELEAELYGDGVWTVGVCSPSYYVNTTSIPAMQDVLVVTLPQRNYTEESHWTLNDTVRAGPGSSCTTA